MELTGRYSVTPSTSPSSAACGTLIEERGAPRGRRGPPPALIFGPVSFEAAAWAPRGAARTQAIAMTRGRRFVCIGMEHTMPAQSAATGPG